MALQVIRKDDKICNQCRKPFQWNPATSWYFGKMEYDSYHDQIQNERYYCSDKCKKQSEKIIRNINFKK